jgi:hypothetical protein
MKITVCDVCKTLKGKLVETERYLRVKGRQDLRLDLCPAHMTKVKVAIPHVNEEYTQFVYAMHGVEYPRLSKAQLKKKYETIV